MKDMSISELQDELDSIIEWFSSESVNLDEVESMYKKGLSVAGLIKAKLEETENKITKIKKSFDKAE